MRPNCHALFRRRRRGAEEVQRGDWRRGHRQVTPGGGGGRRRQDRGRWSTGEEEETGQAKEKLVLALRFSIFVYHVSHKTQGVPEG